MVECPDKINSHTHQDLSPNHDDMKIDVGNEEGTSSLAKIDDALNGILRLAENSETSLDNSSCLQPVDRVVPAELVARNEPFNTKEDDDSLTGNKAEEAMTEGELWGDALEQTIEVAIQRAVGLEAASCPVQQVSGTSMTDLLNKETAGTEDPKHKVDEDVVAIVPPVDEPEELWELTEIVAKTKLNGGKAKKCATEGCELVAASAWVSSFARSEKWYTCIDCQVRVMLGHSLSSEHISHHIPHFPATRLWWLARSGRVAA